MSIINKQKTVDGITTVGAGVVEIASGCTHIVKGTGMILTGTLGHMIGGAALGVGRITKETAKGFVNGVKPNKSGKIETKAKPTNSPVQPSVFQANAPTA